MFEIDEYMLSTFLKSGLKLEAVRLIIDDLLDYFCSYLEEEFGCQYSLEEDSFTADEILSLRLEVAMIVRKACIKILSDCKRGDDSHSYIIDRVLESNIDVLITEVIKRDDFAKEILEHYIGFLVLHYHREVISKEELNAIVKENDWLDTLDERRGFFTLNDLARRVLNEVIYVYTLYDGSLPERLALIDKYFSTSKYDEFILKHAPEWACSLELKNKFKAYQVRLMYADLFANLEYERVTDSNFKEFTKFQFLLDSIVRKKFVLPSSRKKRFEIYREYILLNYDMIVPEIKDAVEDSEGEKIIRMANPLFPLD